jgi:hypothetical protein
VVLSGGNVGVARFAELMAASGVSAPDAAPGPASSWSG